MNTIQILSEGRIYEVESFKFPGGELNVEIKGVEGYLTHPLIVARIQSSDDLVQLMLVNEVMDQQMGCDPSTLLLPYCPYGRQDRITNYRTAFSLRSIARLVNDMDMGRVRLLDPHSDVTAALIEKAEVIEQASVMAMHYDLMKFIDRNDVVLVAPDAGAAKKTEKAARAFGLPMVTASKHRDVRTGEITGTTVHYGGLAITDRTNFLIVDDICDGGRTFVELAKVLKESRPASISLYVTHGIFSKGYEVFDGLIDRIFTADTFLNGLPPHPKVSVQPLNYFQLGHISVY